MNDQPETLLEFPCQFPIKVMGKSDSGFEADALGFVRNHVPDFDAENMRSMPSKKGNYISVTFEIRATSKAQIDAIYMQLTACEKILMVL